MSNGTSMPGFAGGFLLGVVAGLALGVLFAPQSGSRSREVMREKLSELPETVRELTADREKIYKETLKKRRGQPLVSESYFQT